ncbi:hypothetical protein ABZ016_10390 [Streptomyces sp. NPDC006372]|uniref:hypothetical protein n=1 Tax=Streptomyces sp. NPDC006372 TaxID=3155599 RepID=UPI0033A6BA9A
MSSDEIEDRIRGLLVDLGVGPAHDIRYGLPAPQPGDGRYRGEPPAKGRVRLIRELLLCISDFAAMSCTPK